MATPERPHYLLFSTTEPHSTEVTAGGRWRFHLESVDGSATFGAADDEFEIDTLRLELLAVVRGLEALDHPSRVTLVTASRYVSRGIRLGLRSWRETNWRWEDFGRMTPVRNADLWRRTDIALGIHQVRCKSWQLETAIEAAGAAHHYRKPARRSAYSNGHRNPHPIWLRLKNIGRHLSPQRTVLCPQ